jgi:3'(2'), 5'-bisphosphate nucleotidase
MVMETVQDKGKTKENKIDLRDLLTTAIKAAEAACKDILEVYNSNDFQAEAKGDNSPLTLADKKAHNTISKILKSTKLPILSEEGKSIPYEERKNWEYFWLVDPLDGTKEFIKRNGEFTVNIALIYQSAPVMGVVSVPVTGITYFASAGKGAFIKQDDTEIKLPKHHPIDLATSGLRIVASRSHMNDETQEFINKLKEPKLVSKGSSLKFMLLAQGNADVYPRYAPTMEWDTAAAHAIVNEVGAKVLQFGKKEELLYNKPDLLNPYFLVI